MKLLLLSCDQASAAIDGLMYFYTISAGNELAGFSCFMLVYKAKYSIMLAFKTLML